MIPEPKPKKKIGRTKLDPNLTHLEEAEEDVEREVVEALEVVLEGR